jgi:type II secretory pathway component PulM
MTHSQWMIAGAVMLGIAVLVYLVFFCPAECH